jgi:predicted phosphodiesterase
MSNKYTYPDPYLSLWQSAAAEVSAARKNVASVDTAFLAQPTPDFSAPIHVVADAAAGGLKSLPPVEGALGVVGDCAANAAKFLWAEIIRDHAKAQLYSDELKKAVCDAAGWSTCLATYLAYKASGGELPYRDHTNVIEPIPDKVRIGIIGDWGTGEHGAISLLNEIKKQSPDLLVHLGDIYYSGTQHEAKANFLDICRAMFGGTYRLFTLCGNHDMYSGGQGYYWLIDQIGQGASYFALKNKNWQLLAMDTGHNDSNPMTVSSNMTSLNSNEAQWHLAQITASEGRQTILLSHHQLFSAFGSVGKDADGKNYAYNPNLYSTFKNILGQVEWWFWGHEHTLAIYEPYMALKRGRCVGCSAVPVYTDQQSYTVDQNLVTLGPDGPKWQAAAQVGVTGNLYNYAFAILSLDGATASVEYFQAPIDGTCSSLFKE